MKRPMMCVKAEIFSGILRHYLKAMYQDFADYVCKVRILSGCLGYYLKAMSQLYVDYLC